MSYSVEKNNPLMGGTIISRAFSVLNTRDGIWNGCDGVVRLVMAKNGLKFSFENTSIGKALVSSPLRYVEVYGDRIQGISKNGSVISATYKETTGLWRAPNGMAAIAYHTGWFYGSSNETLNNRILADSSVEILVAPDNNQTVQVVLTVGEVSYLIMPISYRYEASVLLGEDGVEYEYIVMTINSSHNYYRIVLQP